MYFFNFTFQWIKVNNFPISMCNDIVFIFFYFFRSEIFFIKFLVYSHSSCLETKGHLLKIKNLYAGLISEIERFINDYDILGAKIFNFIKYVENNWQT